MRVFQTIAALRGELDTIRGPLGLVPTMGALHAGHARLIEVSVHDNPTTAVSIFVNPSQFNDPADFDKYPRTLEADLALCESLGADIVFTPSAEEMYPRPQQAFVDVGRVTEHLEGRFRPGHFRGVATVVMKLLQIALPDRAYFGQKDYQQLAMIRRMVEDLYVPVEIWGVHTVREPDGLALSSRNQRLSPAERAAAPELYRALQRAAACIGQGVLDPADVKRAALAVIASPLIRHEYIEIVDPLWVEPVECIEGPVRIAIAAFLGDVRLIDNIFAEPPA
jgi:pantoate--beta-alanine ligase